MCSTLSNDPEEWRQMAFALLYEEAVVGILKNIIWPHQLENKVRNK